MASCNQDITNPADAPLIWNEGTRGEKNPLDEIDFSALDTAYFVSDKDVEAYVHFKQLLAEGQGKEFEMLEVVPMGLNDEATLAYLLNYNEGWEIIAADKRAPTVLASGEEGSFSEKEAPENVMAWIECLESDVLGLRVCKERPEWADEEAWDNMLSSADFWLAINADKEYIARAIEGTRIADPLIPIDDPDDPILSGHWELYSTTSTKIVYDSIHLTKTDWNQQKPYNNRAPFRTSLPSYIPPQRTAAGCAAVAAAQLLFYLNRTFGYPISTPRNAYCNDDVDSHPEIIVSNDFSSTIWDHMYVYGETPAGLIEDYKDSASVLIATCAKRLAIVYSNKGGGLRDMDYYRDSLFSSYCINCTGEMSYNSGIVISELLRRMPVIISAYAEDVAPLGFHLYYNKGHVFLIDGYKRFQKKYYNTYIYVYPEGVPRPDTAEYETVVSFSAPSIELFAMNWGKWDFNNKHWYAPTGDWSVKGDNYQYKRKMVYGFSNLN